MHPLLPALLSSFPYFTSFRKRGCLDFWLSSKWFDLRAENVQTMTKTPIPSTQLAIYRSRLRSRESGTSTERHDTSQVHLN